MRSKRGISVNPIYVWLALIVIFAIAEAMMLGLVSIWFSFGALLAMLAATLGLSVIAQVIIFAVGSAVLLAATKPFMKKYKFLKNEKTNSDRIINEIGHVTETINNIDASGKVKVLGQIWTARSETGSEIPKGENVRIVRIEGVKAYVVQNDKED